MTTKDAILGLAAKISGSTVPNVTTDAQALSELAKAMCGSAPTEPIATVDDAIAYITANYSGGGGGGGGGTTDLWIWNLTDTPDLLTITPSAVEYATAFDTETGDPSTFETLEFEAISEEVSLGGQTGTFHGVHVEGAPAGALIMLSMPTGYSTQSFGLGYAQDYDVMTVAAAYVGADVALMPIEGLRCVGKYAVDIEG